MHSFRFSKGVQMSVLESLQADSGPQALCLTPLV